MCELGDVLVHTLLLLAPISVQVGSFHILVERLCIPLLLGESWLLRFLYSADSILNI